MEAILLDTLVFLVPIAFFSFLAVTIWARNRRREREAYYKNENLKKIAEAQGPSANAALEFLREQEKFRAVRHREGLGLGDVKLVAMIGVFLGLEATLLILLIGSLAGSVISVLYIWATKRDAASYQLPFGSFLSAAALAVALAGPRLLGLYIQ